MIGVLAGKWAPGVLLALGEQPLRYNRLLEQLPGVSRRMLTATLRGLARDGLVERRQLSTTPKRVQYSLTPAGFELLGVLDEFARWERRHERIRTGAPIGSSF